MPDRIATPTEPTATHPAAVADQRKRPGLQPAAITPGMIAQLRALSEPRWSVDGSHVYYLESHDGQGALFRVPVAGGAALRLTADPPAAGAASYAGGFYTVSADGVVFLGADRALYRIPVSGGPARKIPTGDGSASAPAFSPDGRQIAYVVDDGTTADIGIAEASGEDWPRKISVPADFVADPAWSPNGRLLAWIEWSVPNMAWDQSRIVVYDTRTGTRHVVIDEPEVACSQPRWSPDGKTLAFLCDRDGYMNFWRANGDGSAPASWVAEPYDHAGPTWVSGQASFAWSPDGRRLAYQRLVDGNVLLRVLDVASGETHAIGEPRGTYGGLRWAPRGDALLTIYQGAAAPPAMQVLDLKRGGRRTLATAALGGLTGEGCVWPEPIAWRGRDGLELHGLLYRPATATSSDRPPLLVSIHGGPTGQSGVLWNPVVQYFVQRGWAVFAPNARGSSGYGRAYIQALRDEWGGADMADIAAGIDYVADQGWADADRVVCWGGSAGGYAVLLLPILYPDHFKAAVSLFGVSDLFHLARTTHRLEAHYLDRIVGPLPEAAARYHDRSPVFHAARYGAPLLMLQGDTDVAVPLEQARLMADALRAAGKPVVLHVYEGEGHGWLRAATIRDYIERMDRFLEEYALLR